MNRFPKVAGRLAAGCVAVSMLLLAAPPAAGKLVVRTFDKKAYPKDSRLTFVVDAHDENGPVAGLAPNGEWGLHFGDKSLKVQPKADSYRAGGEITTSILFLVPATSAIIGADEVGSEGDRARTPLRYVLDGFQTLYTQVNDKDCLAVGCYTETEGNATLLSSGVKPQGKVQFPKEAEEVARMCAPSGSAAGGGPGLESVLRSTVKPWVNQKCGSGIAQRLVVVVVADGNSSAPVSPEWARNLVPEGEGRWLETYVIGLSDGGNSGNLAKLGQSANWASTVPVRQNVPAELQKLAPWLAGEGVYQVAFTLDDAIRSKSAELVLTVGSGRQADKSDPVAVGVLDPQRSWWSIALLVLVILLCVVFVVLLIRFIVLSAAERRRRREEEEARRPKEYDGPSRGRLIVREGPCANQTFHLVDDVTFLGRSPENHVAIPDGSVGKRHCSITIQDKSFQIEDLQSVNGVFLNGQKVLKAFLKDGDSIRLGSSEMQFRL